MSKLGTDLIQGMTEAVAFARGSTAGAVVHVVDVSNVQAVRRDQAKVIREALQPALG